MYRPLPKCLTIKKSPIEGLGLYATKNIKANCFIGLTHIQDKNFDNGYIRTPLGGSINHSDNPNCIKYVPDMVVTPNITDSHPDYMSLKTIKNIKKGEELTVAYTLYSIEKSSNVVIDEEGNVVKIERV